MQLKMEYMTEYMFHSFFSLVSKLIELKLYQRSGSVTFLGVLLCILLFVDARASTANRHHLLNVIVISQIIFCFESELTFILITNHEIKTHHCGGFPFTYLLS